MYMKRKKRKKNLNLHIFVIMILIGIMIYAGYLFINFLKENKIIESKTNNYNKKSISKHEKKDKIFNDILNELNGNKKENKYNSLDEKSNTKSNNILKKIFERFTKKKIQTESNNFKDNPSKNIDKNEKKDNNQLIVQNKFQQNNNISENYNQNINSKNKQNTVENNQFKNKKYEDRENSKEDEQYNKKENKILDKNSDILNYSDKKNTIKKNNDKISIHKGNFYIYLCKLMDDGTIKLEKFPSKIEYTDSPIYSTITYLINTKINGYLNLIPEGTILKEAWIKNGILYLNFNKKFLHNTYGIKAIDAQIKQIVKTAMQFKNVKGIKFQIEGKTPRYFSDEGYIMDIIFK